MSQYGVSLTDDSKGIIYDRNVFLIQATSFFIQEVTYDKLHKHKYSLSSNLMGVLGHLAPGTWHR